MGRNSTTSRFIAGFIVGALFFGWGFFVLDAMPTQAVGVGAHTLKDIYNAGKGKKPEKKGPICTGANAGTPMCTPQCWKKEDCNAVKGATGADSIWEGNKTTEVICGPKEDGWGFCYPAPADIALQVPIGSLTTASNAVQYVKAAYVFLLGIAGLVAVIVFMHAGFLWLTAGGNAANISRAKEYIQNASLGMLLVFGSYTFLSVINPDLVNLKVPRAYLFRNQALDLQTAKNMEGQFCDTQNDALACKASCQGCACVGIRESGMSVLGKYVAWGSTALASAGLLGGSGISALARGGWWITKKIGSFFKHTHRVVGATLGPKANVLLFLGELAALNSGKEAFEEWLGGNHGLPFGGDRLGLCIADKNKNIPIGGKCVDVINCKAGGGSKELKCFQTDWIPNVGGFGFKIGICSDGSEGSACANNNDCDTPLMSCVDGPDNSKWCSKGTSRSQGSPCNTNNCQDDACRRSAQCASGLRCAIVEENWSSSLPFADTNGHGWCVDGSGPTGAGGLAACTADGDCDKTAGGQQLKCLDGTLGGAQGSKSKICTSLCDSDKKCQDICPEGKTCVCRENSEKRKVCMAPSAKVGQGEQCDTNACEGDLKCTKYKTDLGRVCTKGGLNDVCTIQKECGEGLLCGFKSAEQTVCMVKAPLLVPCESTDECVAVYGAESPAFCTEGRIGQVKVCTLGSIGAVCASDNDCNEGSCKYNKCSE